MSGSILLFDTNAFIAWSNEDTSLARQAVHFAQPVVTLITIGELVFGALKSSKPEENRNDLNRRLRSFELFVPDRKNANIYGQTCIALRRKGKPIPDNDIWIAALALQHGLPIITRDAHFSVVEGLTVLN